MLFTDIANIRLNSQKIIGHKLSNVKEVVSYMGAMQAQDYAMSKWAIGIRLKNSTENIVEQAINNGEIFRTHLLRPTWHFVSSEDIYWLLKLTSPQIKKLMKTRNKELELTEEKYLKTNRILENILNGNNYLTREEITSEFEKEKIVINDNRLSHILMNTELDGIICSGRIKNNKQTYALLQERINIKSDFSKDESLKKIAEKYFFSHYPATLNDFVWWSGLTVKDAKNAIEMNKNNLASEKINSETYYLKKDFLMTDIEESAYLLPAFDEFIISYKDRTAALLLENHKKAISSNGIFRPVIVVNGQVKGVWKRTIKKDNVIIELDFFESIENKTKSILEKYAEKYGYFLNKKESLVYSINSFAKLK